MFEKNIAAIKAKNPTLAEKLCKIELDSIEGIDVVEAESEDLVIGYKGIALHNIVDPIREARAIWDKAIKSDLRKNDVQIVFGLGLGYLFKRAYVNSDSKVYLVEPFPEILRFVLQHVDLSAELSDERVFVTDNVEDIEEKLSEEYLQGDKAEVLFLPAYGSLAKEELTQLAEKTVKAIEGKASDVNTIFNLTPSWAYNIISNLPNFKNSLPLGFLSGQFEGKTALILAAGPSLAENIEKIKQNKGKFVTIAVGKALKTLKENDFVPDFVSFADARGLKNQIEGFEDLLAKTNVIMASRADKELSQIDSKSHIIYLPETDLYSQLFQDNCEKWPGIYKSASSVSIINYFIAQALGFSTIAFAGLDLAFVGNKTYASGEELKTDKKGYIESLGILSNTRKLKYTKNKNGQEIPTRDDYLVFIRQFEDILEKEITLSKLINTSTNGAYIKGMEYLEFDELIETLSAQDIDIDNIISKELNDNKICWNNCVHKVFNKLNEQKPEIETIHLECENMMKELDKTIESITQKEEIDIFDHSELSELRQKTTHLRQRIVENLILKSALQGSLWEFAQKYKTEDLNNKENIQHNLEKEELLFRRTFHYSKNILTLLDKSSKDIENTSVKETSIK